MIEKPVTAENHHRCACEAVAKSVPTVAYGRDFHYTATIFVYGFVFCDPVETPACDVLIKTEQTICYTAGKGKLK